MTKSTYDIVVIGGGAAGFFFAINFKRKNPESNIVILEKSGKVLSKVLVSGGGRCNVTHACFEPRELVKYYPRGSKELLGPFHKFQPGDTIGWFSERGVELKIEDDGRMFPITDSSQTIIDCFQKEITELKIPVRFSCGVNNLSWEDQLWQITSANEIFLCKNVFISSGSSPAMWDVIESTGHTIINPVPSLFTFNCKAPALKDLMGVSVPNGRVTIPELKVFEFGPVLITHWGLSGPGILKLSSVAARELFDLNYKFKIKINWNADYEIEDLVEVLTSKREIDPKQSVGKRPAIELPKRLWHNILAVCQINSENNWADLSNKKIRELAIQICDMELNVNGKSTFKEEFVTAGGVDLKEIDFRTMASRISPGLYFGGEVMNIDALTGGFNFQAAWTTAWIASQNMEV